ncbi:MAG: alpha/beta fold hydrolase [Capnocytophaga felis]|nr:alpha/beta fold hydrolase [Capnocytophaga felis]
MEYNSFYKKAGKGKTVILLHGFLESCEVWNELIEVLEKDFHFIVPDLLGHGKTPAISKIHTMEMMAQQVLSILENENIEECILVGHSMGGYVSLAFAEKYPQKVKGVILMNSTPLPDSDEKKANRERVVNLVDNDKTFFIRNSVTNLFSEENKLLMKEKIEKIINIALQTPAEGIKAASLGMKDRPNRTLILKALQAPKHFIIGKEDALIPHEELAALTNEIGATYSLLDGGHMSFIEDKLQTISILKNFINEV